MTRAPRSTLIRDFGPVNSPVHPALRDALDIPVEPLSLSLMKSGYWRVRRLTLMTALPCFQTVASALQPDEIDKMDPWCRRKWPDATYRLQLAEQPYVSRSWKRRASSFGDKWRRSSVDLWQSFQPPSPLLFLHCHARRYEGEALFPEWNPWPFLYFRHW